ncbi:hypothetical protein [Nocardia sp. NPDC006630]|uniref:hypothetical protein n=1 Tax=Nocardia sp. NPDC006630 TaxID=3157181 RepID=UPI0033B75A90
MPKVMERYHYAFDDKYFGVSRNFHEREVPVDAHTAFTALAAKIVWPLFARYFHDAVVENVFDAGLDYLGYPPAAPAEFPVVMRIGAKLLQTRVGQWAWTTLSSMGELVDDEWGRVPFNGQGIPTNLDYSSIARSRVREPGK